MIIKSRTKARELALQYLYQVDVTESYNPDNLDSFCVTFSKESDDETIAYARSIIEGIYSNIQEIDSAIDRSSKNWTVRRMSYVDRNILRMSTYELMFRIDIPIAVVINEGIELAKKFGSPKLPSFVNAVLDKISQKNAR